MEILELEDSDTVVLADDELEIKHLIVRGEAPLTAKALVGQGHELEPVVRRMIDVGGIVLRYGADRVAVDSLGFEVDRLIEAVNETATAQLPDVLSRYSEELGSLFAKHFDSKQVTSVQQQVPVILASAMRDHQREFARGLLDETGPLGIVRADLVARMGALAHSNEMLTDKVVSLESKLAVAEAQRATRERGVEKGLEYEDLVAGLVEMIHAPLEDTVQHVGNEAGVSGGRVGDLIVDVNPHHLQGRTARIVIEAKCRQLSMKAALSELDRAMINRDAYAGVLVFAGLDLAPLKGRSLRVCTGNKILAVLDRESGDPLALEAACIIARAAASRKATEAEFEMGAQSLDAHVGKLVAILDEAKMISRGVTVARKGVDQIDTAYTAMRAAALAALADIRDVLAGKAVTG